MLVSSLEWIRPDALIALSVQNTWARASIVGPIRLLGPRSASWLHTIVLRRLYRRGLARLNCGATCAVHFAALERENTASHAKGHSCRQAIRGDVGCPNTNGRDLRVHVAYATNLDELHGKPGS